IQGEGNGCLVILLFCYPGCLFARGRFQQDNVLIIGIMACQHFAVRGNRQHVSRRPCSTHLPNIFARSQIYYAQRSVSTHDAPFPLREHNLSAARAEPEESYTISNSNIAQLSIFRNIVDMDMLIAPPVGDDSTVWPQGT